MRKLLSLILAIILIISILPISAMALEDGGEYELGGDGAGWSDIINGAEFVAKNGVLTAYNGKGGVVVIPEGITGIDESVFSKSTSQDKITAVIIPDGVVTIKQWAFSNCKALKYVVLPSSLTTVEKYAFNGCTAIQDVFYRGKKSQTSSLDISEGGNSYLKKALCHYNTCKHSEHVYSGDSDLSCNNCEWFKDHTHIYDSDCDETCGKCSRKITPVADHNFKEATCTDPKTCSKCGKTEGKQLGHTYSGACDTKCNVCEKTRTPLAAHSEYDNACDPTCNVCGEVRSVPNHVYENTCDTNCNVCGFERNASPHSWEAATCLKPSTCSICGETRGEVLEHTYDNDCDAECNACHTQRTPPHNYANKYICDEDYHWYECQVEGCGQKKEPLEHHVFDNAEDMICDVCGYERKHIYDSPCDTDCNKCGFVREPNHSYVFDASEHEHRYVCSGCGVKTTFEKHIFDHDCDKYCNVCNFERTAPGHKYSSSSDKYCDNCNQERIVISKQPVDVTVSADSKPKITVTATGSGMNYQWEINTNGTEWKPTKTSGHTTNTIVITAQAIRNGYQYRCVITDKYGNKVISNAAKLTVVTTKITKQPTNESAVLGNKQKFSVSATGLGLTYRWQIKVPGGSWKYTSTKGNRTQTITVVADAVRNKYQYRCVVTDAAGKKTYSKAATITVVSPNVSKNPSSIKVAAGDSVQFSVTASGIGIKYQWQVKAPGGSWKNSATKGNKTKTITVSASDSKNGYLYRCVVTDVAGNKVTSKSAKLTVVKTVISKQPTSVKAAASKTTKFTVAATGVGIKYQWQVKVPGGSWKNSGTKGNKTKTITVSANAVRNKYQYRCVITDGAGKKTYSKAATLTVVTTKITSQPINKTVSSGSKASFSVRATGVGLKYRWQVKTPSGKWTYTTTSGYKTNTLTAFATKARNGYKYRCVITDEAGKKTYSKAATLTVK
ncbi:MAG: leucine-rich repeat protein [Clostridia bacterium]|nr:leucine-rich repeat protein [Clostridia bacterium]